MEECYRLWCIEKPKCWDDSFKELNKKRAKWKTIHDRIKDTVSSEARWVKKEESGTLLTLEFNCISTVGAYGITKKGSNQKFIWRISLEKQL